MGQQSASCLPLYSGPPAIAWRCRSDKLSPLATERGSVTPSGGTFLVLLLKGLEGLPFISQTTCVIPYIPLYSQLFHPIVIRQTKMCPFIIWAEFLLPCESQPWTIIKKLLVAFSFKFFGFNYNLSIVFSRQQFDYNLRRLETSCWQVLTGPPVRQTGSPTVMPVIASASFNSTTT